ncbi:PEP-utilizing enzyme, mobile region [bacterium]|nr:PEP-utilizing enzyme, mobile region [bacterium]MBU2599374.1 PEP-utilizing enzyme, mobile region [bacterium]
MSIQKTTKRSFPSPFEVQTPEGAQGWEKMYPYYLLFSQECREFEERFWFCDTMHHTTPLYPFDCFTAESWGPALGAYNSRIFIVPPALGIAQRVLNGYLYISPISVDNPDEIKIRIQDFSERAGFYYQNWDTLYARWKEKVTVEIEELKKLTIPHLPEKEDISLVKNAVGISTGFRLQEAYNRLLESMMRVWAYHFEFLNLGYAAFLDFSCFMKTAFPDISEQTITQMVAGIDVILFRPDTELRRLAKHALSLNLQNIFLDTASVDQLLSKLEANEGGKQWLDSLEAVKDPWFYFNSGTGFYHTPRSWIDDLSVPFSAIKGYIKKILAGQEIERKTEEIKKEAERLKDGYAKLLKTEEDKKAFMEKLSLAKTVFPYVEEHNFYVEHWHHTIFWNKMRQLSRVFIENNFFQDEEDIFYLNRYEISQALYELCSTWAIGSVPRGPKYWPEKINQRKKIISALSRYQPIPALGTPPEKITEPFTIMLWGVVSERIEAWLESQTTGTKGGALIKGHPASPGVAEGKAIIILSVEDLDKIKEGEVMVCPITTPSWTPIFSKIAAVVTNVGGVMSHAAIVCREYGIPAVVGTGFATQLIKTGQLVRVDGKRGIVEVLE